MELNLIDIILIIMIALLAGVAFYFGFLRKNKKAASKGCGDCKECSAFISRDCCKR